MEATAGEAAGREAWPPSCGLPEVVYADGSADYGTDPSLARTAWAVVWRERRVWRRVTGPCPGAQLPHRAKLAAFFWAARADPPPQLVVTDCACVADGAVGRADGRRRRGDSADGDLWHELPASLPPALWVPSRLEAQEGSARGVPPEHWEGKLRPQAASLPPGTTA